MDVKTPLAPAAGRRLGGGLALSNGKPGASIG